MNIVNKFDSYVCPGDSVTIEDGLFTFTSRIEYDQDSCPTEYMDENDPQDAEAIRAWRNGEWFFCGIVIDVAYNDIELDTNVVGLWSIEANYPGSDNSYLNEVVQDLLPEAKQEAQKRLEEIRAKLAA